MANDLIVQTTVDRRVMAILLDLFEIQGADIRSISELARLSFETLATIAVKNFGVEERTSTADATARLSEITYGTALLNNKKYGAGLLKKLQEQQKEDEVVFEALPNTRGRKPIWGPNDDERLRNAAEKALTSPKMQELLKQLNNRDK